jgi:hypothetical protein
MVYIGSAGWNIPRVHRERFASDGSRDRRLVEPGRDGH